MDVPMPQIDVPTANRSFKLPAPAPDAERLAPSCRFCAAALRHTFVDLGMSPLCESYVPAERLAEMERFYPLHARVCERCLLVQLDEFVAPQDIFSEYAYFSSYSDSWVAHAARYVDAAIQRFDIGRDDLVMEIASNDGYLLQHVAARGIRAVGIEPARNIAVVAQARGIDTVVEFFGRRLGHRLEADGFRADLLVANNVMAHVPDVNDFVAGMATVLAPEGVLTIEVPHLLQLVQGNQFDTIYHEHFSYFSFLTARALLEAHGLDVFDVEELSTHGGSLRIYAQLRATGRETVTAAVARLVERERALGYDTLEAHSRFSAQVTETKWGLLEFLIDARRAGRRVAGYGAPGKGNTLLNYCGIRSDLLEFTVDRNPYKQGRFLPGTHIPIRHPDALADERPDYVLILPWNLKEEIAEQLAGMRRWGTRFVVPIPQVEVL